MLAGRWDKRRKKRQSRHHPALISCRGAQNPPIPCILCDISPGGARLAPVRLQGLPDEFTLLLNKDGSSRRLCRVVWRKKRHVGVQFISGADRADAEHKDAAPKVPLATQSGVAGACHWHAQTSSAAICIDRRELTLSSLAALVLMLLIVATTVFYVAGVQMADETPWAMELCENAKNFCQHPEWSAVPAALMALVYLSVKGMEL